MLSGIQLNHQKQTRMRNLLGVEHVLQKPINPFEFIRLIRKQLHMQADPEISTSEQEKSHDMQNFNDADLDEELDGEMEDIKDTYLHDLPALQVLCLSTVFRK